MILSPMFLDITPAGGKRRIVSRKQIQNIKKGGEIADEIREMSDHHHEHHEVPKAEAHIEDALENWPEKKQEENLGKQEVRKSLWQKIKSFFKA